MKQNNQEMVRVEVSAPEEEEAAPHNPLVGIFSIPLNDVNGADYEEDCISQSDDLSLQDERYRRESLLNLYCEDYKINIDDDDNGSDEDLSIESETSSSSFETDSIQLATARGIRKRTQNTNQSSSIESSINLVQSNISQATEEAAPCSVTKRTNPRRTRIPQDDEFDIDSIDLAHRQLPGISRRRHATVPPPLHSIVVVDTASSPPTMKPQTHLLEAKLPDNPTLAVAAPDIATMKPVRVSNSAA